MAYTYLLIAAVNPKYIGSWTSRTNKWTQFVRAVNLHLNTENKRRAVLLVLYSLIRSSVKFQLNSHYGATNECSRVWVVVETNLHNSGRQGKRLRCYGVFANPPAACVVKICSGMLTGNYASRIARVYLGRKFQIH